MIRAGEKVYDDDGTLIGEFCSDFSPGQILLTTDFILANGEHPEPYTLLHYKIGDLIKSRIEESNDGAE